MMHILNGIVIKMEKVYLKNGNSTPRGNRYCMKHFIEIHKRDPNIMDVATIGICRKCSAERNCAPNEWD